MSDIKRKKIIAGNWKMNKSIAEAVSAVKELGREVSDVKGKEIVICPPFTALSAASGELKKSNIKLGAQNMHYEGSGAFTGEISPLMLKDAGCEYVILGHSERREMGEDDSLINRKVISALKNGLTPILCIGETHEQRMKDETQDELENQLIKCLQNVKEVKKI